MGNFHLLALEDNLEYQDVLRDMLAQYPGNDRLNIDIISSVSTLEALLASGDHIDVFLCDISFGSEEPTGIDLVRRHFPAGCDTQVIYISGYIEFCTPVYQTEHTYFLIKPIKQEDFNAAIDKALKNLQGNDVPPVAIQHGGAVTMVNPAEIEYIKSDRRKVRLYVTSGDILETYATLGQMTDMLPDDFVQCHKSYIVNMAYISELRTNSVLLRSGAEVPVSQRQRKAIRDLFFHYVGLNAQ